jgi:beta-lactamase regulating signal transducer with metallopeptidase domain
MELAAMNLLMEISRLTALAFVSGLWQGLVLIAAVAVGLRLLPRLSATVRFAVWGLAFAAAVAVPLVHLHVTAAPGEHASSAAVHLGAGWGLAIAAVWAVFMAVRIAQLAVQAVRLRRIWKRATPVAVGSEISGLLASGRRGAELCTSADVDSPNVIGFFAPRLLIPEWLFAKLTEAELRQIVMHECEHLRRGDDWVNLLQKIALAMFPLNPALLWVDRRLGLERELACDAGVVASTAAPFDYAHCLTRLAEHRIGYRRVALALSAWSRQSELARRVHSLLRPMRKMSPLQARASIGLLGLGLAGGAVGLAHTPRFVSFADAVASPSVEADVAPMIAAPERAVPVTYLGSSQQPHETLLKAVMPAKAPHAVPAVKQVKKQKPSSQVQLRSANAMRAPQKPHVVLTSATMPAVKMHRHQVSDDAPPEFYEIPAVFMPSYAAVPFADGWLIIQL